MTFLLLVAGLVVLTAGGEVLVRGASSLAAALRISPLVIGLTIVAFGTSAPELVVSLQSALSGQGDIALGNVMGSNIFNVLFILGLSALIVPLVVSQQLVRFDVPLMVAVSILTLVLALDGRIGRLDGLLLFSGIVAYTLWALVHGRKEQKGVQEEYAQQFGPPAKTTLRQWLGYGVMIVGGLVLLVVGSRMFVSSAVQIARAFGVSELVIGLTLVAAGTSLPEVATSLLAALRGQRDIAVGNVVGSNLFNLMGVLGLTAITAREGIAVSPEALALDLPFMVAVAIACLPIFFTGHRIDRWEGALFFGYYLAYTLYLVLVHSESEYTAAFSGVMRWFVVPLTIVTLGIGIARAWRSNNRDANT